MKKINPVLQSDLKDCGVCSMQWIIKYYGGFISLEKLREETLTDINGTNAFNIVNTFKRWGFDSQGVLEHDITSNKLKYPLIAHLILDNGLEHFVVVKEIVDDTIYLMDPGIGNEKMTIARFNKLFTGNIIEVYPRESIVKMDKEISICDLLFKIIKKEKFLFIKIIFTSLIWTFLLVISSYYLKVGSNLINDDENLIKYLIIAFAIITLIKIFCFYIREYYENHLSNLIDVYIYPEFIRHLFFLPLKNVKSRTTGEIITRIGELSSIKSLFSDVFVSCLLDSIMMFCSIIILYVLNVELFLILVIFLFVYIIFGIITSKIMYKKVLENVNYQTDFNSVLVEFVDMFESIKNLNVLKVILKKIEDVLSRYLFNNYEFGCFYNLSNLGKDFILECSFFFINSYGLWCVVNGKLEIIDLFTFNIILSYCIDPVKNMINLLPKYNYIKASFSKITEFINIEEEKILAKSIDMKGDIIFNKVSYSYNNYDYILKDFSFTIKEGSHILLNGPSGSGKSTICKILYKENLASKGSVLIGDNNIKDLTISTIRNNVLYISQNEELFTGTIKDNIIIGRCVNDNLFKTVCNICRIDEIVNKKSLRYNSIIEPSAKNISGGEKQRIILARGLLKNANIIILDEALSEVDQKLEGKIIKDIRKLFCTKTIIYISHKNQINNFECILNLGDKNELFQN